jgi:tRNA(Ile)-lysidine synthase
MPIEGLCGVVDRKFEVHLIMHQIQRIVSGFSADTERSFGLVSGERIIVAVSGGLDSMVLLYLLHNAGFKCIVAHVNYHLRGTDSDEDEALVKAFCEAEKIPFEVRHADPEAIRDGNLQDNARVFRYNFFEEIREKYACRFVAVAHHKDDAVETVLWKFIRGNYGLAPLSMKQQRDAIIRPLMNYSKTTLRDMALGYSIPWREDVSNQRSDYTRNKIRNEIIPVINMIQPGFHDMLLDKTRHGSMVEEFVRMKLREEMEVLIEERSTEWLIGQAWLKQDGFDLLRAGFICEKWDWPTHRAEELVRLQQAENGKFLESASWRFVKQRDGLLVVKNQTMQQECVMLSKEDLLSGQFALTGEMAPAVIDTTLSSNVILVDADRLEFPLVWRPWQQGDAIVPLGMRGRKLVSDLLIDLKVEIEEKKSVFVLCSGERIVWVAGLRMSNDFKLTAQTKAAMKLMLN